MKTTESLAELYRAIDEMEGPSRARQHVSVVVSFIIGNIQDENLPVTAEEIERRLHQEALDFRSMVDHHKKKSIA
jgi:hypothetical protein